MGIKVAIRELRRRNWLSFEFSGGGEMQTRVLYFSEVNVGGLTITNGGNLCCRNHIKRLAADPELDLHVVIAGSADGKASNVEFLRKQEVPHRYITLNAPNTNRKNTLEKYLTGRVRYPHEESALANPHVEAELQAAMDEWKIESLVIDYLPSTLYCKRLLQRENIVLITLNREGEFFRDLRQLGLTGHGQFGGWVSQLRWDSYERWAYRKAAKVVSIGEPDLPRITGLRSDPVCVTPYLDAKSNQWKFTNSRSAFFVGNIHHYPNRLAIEWLATKFAPALSALAPEFRIDIVGADESQVPADWLTPNVNFEGVSTPERVVELFSSSDLFICPVENDYGMKFKVAEALSYGTPMMASKETMLAVPYLSTGFGFDLTDPANAASRAAKLMGNSLALNDLHESQILQQEAFVSSQSSVWSSVIKSVRKAA